MINNSRRPSRHNTIQSLQTMEVSEALQLMLTHFPEETAQNKRSILYAIKKMGAYKDLQTLVPHIHKEIETIAYLLEGECTLFHGDNLEQQTLVIHLLK